MHKFYYAYADFNTWRPGQNGWHFKDNIFKLILFNQNFVFWFKFHFVAKGSIDNKSLFAQVMAWCLPGTKTLPELMMTQFTDAPQDFNVLNQYSKIMYITIVKSLT